MNKILKYCFFLFIILCANFTLQGQVLINFNPVINGQTLEGLSFAQIFNSSTEEITGRVKIYVRNISEGNIVIVQTSSMNFLPGLNYINRSIYSNSSFNFGRNNTGRQLSQTGKFAEGNYEYCFEVMIEDAKTVSLIGTYENCFNSDIQPITPLFLINPLDGDEICNKRPDFTWQPPVPLSNGSMFRLILTEIKNKQTGADAMSFNLPVINEPNINSSILLYPQSIPSLEKGKKYGWQVTVYNNKTILTKSDIWVFSINCSEEKPPVAGESYRELNEKEDGNYYFARGELRFSFYNPYNEGDLKYSIANVASPNTIIKGFQKLKIKTGINKYIIDLSDNNHIKNDQQYILRVYLPNGKELSLRFIYQE